jgi:hypothetical protein
MLLPFKPSWHRPAAMHGLTTGVELPTRRRSLAAILPR